ncbi:MAG: hypothetical protein WAV02_04225, partial [Stellaceae bacterium]
RYDSASGGGRININIDDLGNRYEGVAFLVADGNAAPPVIARLITNNRSKTITTTISTLGSIHPQTLMFDRWDNLRQHYPQNIAFPNRADVKIKWNAKQLAVNWTTDLGTSGSATLPRTTAGTASQLKPLVHDWNGFKDFVSNLDVPTPNFSILEFMAMDNERLIPQQAVSSLSNVDDIETYISEREAQSGRTYLTAIDLPLADRRRVMDELSYMGITAGSLFPGLDGACEEIRERSFNL